MSFANLRQPNIPDFILYLRSQGVSDVALPDTSPFIEISFSYAVAITLPSPMSLDPTIYTLAVYNLGTHMVFVQAPDQTGSTFFADERYKLQLNNPRSGVIAQSQDVTTSAAYTVPTFNHQLTLESIYLQLTQWGRNYLMYAQKYGPNICAIS